MDAPIREVSVSEHAAHAAKLAIETHEQQQNPHPEGSHDFRRWQASYSRYLKEHGVPDAEASA